jgi:hypothetical protein
MFRQQVVILRVSLIHIIHVHVIYLVHLLVVIRTVIGCTVYIKGKHAEVFTVVYIFMPKVFKFYLQGCKLALRGNSW